MDIKPIKNEEDYKSALSQLEKVFDAPINSEEGDLALVLSTLIVDWESKNYPIENLEPDWSIDSLYKMIKQACSEEKEITLTDKGLKLIEEVGELASEILKLTGVKHSNLSTKEVVNNILLESCDVMIMVFSIMNQMKFTKQDIIKMTESQIEKWKKLPK
jgi:HTH-type transcriptional regulator/antitoxin HigA